MPTNEYLQAIVERAKAYLPDEIYSALHRAALPVSGGRAAWRGADLSPLESIALRDIRPRMLGQAEDDELTALWARLTQWHNRAGRRKQDQGPFEQAAGHLLQEMQRRGLEAAGNLVDRAVAKSTLAARLEELPGIITLQSPAVSIAMGNDAIEVGNTEDWYGDEALDAMNNVGIPAAKEWLALENREEANLYDLALVRSGAIEKSTVPDHISPPGWILKAEHNGAMIALMAPPHVREELASAGLLQPDAPEDLHITLLYLGEAATLSQSMLAAIINVVEAVCREHRPLRVKLSGIGRFDRAVFGIASAVGMSQLRADLERAVSQVIRLPSEHGWVPHLTLGYGEAALPDLADVKLPAWPSERVRIQVGGQSLTEVPLASHTPGEVAAYEKMIRHEPRKDASKPWALYTRDGSRLLGRHETEQDAEEQERTIRERQRQEKSYKILCSAPERQVIYYVVSEPNSIDLHGHRIRPEDIESALHEYMRGERHMKIEHGPSIDGHSEIVEGFIAPMDLTEFHGEVPPDGPILKGTSIVGVHYLDRAMWEALSKEEHGLSWGGFAEKE